MLIPDSFSYDLEHVNVIDIASSDHCARKLLASAVRIIQNANAGDDESRSLTRYGRSLLSVEVPINPC